MFSSRYVEGLWPTLLLPNRARLAGALPYPAASQGLPRSPFFQISRVARALLS